MLVACPCGPFVLFKDGKWNRYLIGLVLCCGRMLVAEENGIGKLTLAFWFCSYSVRYLATQ